MRSIQSFKVRLGLCEIILESGGLNTLHSRSDQLLIREILRRRFDVISGIAAKSPERHKNEGEKNPRNQRDPRDTSTRAGGPSIP